MITVAIELKISKAGGPLEDPVSLAAAFTAAVNGINLTNIATKFQGSRLFH
jgi:hypothetical protein